MNSSLLSYYQAIEQASVDMLDAARAGNWNHVIKLEAVCVLLISELRQAAKNAQLDPVETAVKSQIMRNILTRDAEIRALMEPWEHHLDSLLTNKPQVLH